MSSLFTKSGLALGTGRAAHDEEKPSGTLRWRILAEVFRTCSMEGRPQGGGSTEVGGTGCCDGALKDIKTTWVSATIRLLSYISYQQHKAPVTHLELNLVHRHDVSTLIANHFPIKWTFDQTQTRCDRYKSPVMLLINISEHICLFCSGRMWCDIT